MVQTISRRMFLVLGGCALVTPSISLSEEDDLRRLKTLSEPRLIGWAAHVADIQALAKRLAQSGVATAGPTPGSRKRPDGRVLRWSVLSLRDDGQGLLPFFIEWSADSPHPSSDSPKGCSLVRFDATTPD